MEGNTPANTKRSEIRLSRDLAPKPRRAPNLSEPAQETHPQSIRPCPQPTCHETQPSRVPRVVANRATSVPTRRAKCSSSKGGTHRQILTMLSQPPVTSRFGCSTVCAPADSIAPAGNAGAQDTALQPIWCALKRFTIQLSSAAARSTGVGGLNTAVESPLQGCAVLCLHLDASRH